ncbi:MAG: hypothetical protein U9R79_14345 [Armatimonadota bacterium]|nr:hypothetical protein [Armatimonadota bacterium]
MTDACDVDDGLCRPQIEIEARQLLGLVCRKGGAECPLIGATEADAILERIGSDPTVAIRLTSDADELPHYTWLPEGQFARSEPEDVLNRKRDLDVLQRLGLCPGDTRRARYLFELLFERIETPQGICAHDTAGWEGCELASSGAYESVRNAGWDAVVYLRSDSERAEYRQANERAIAEGESIFIRPHHLMCMCCWWAGGEGAGPRPNDTLAEILERIQSAPDVPITLVEGCCEACDCCDGYDPDTGRCVHAGGLIRDYKKDLDCFQRMGLMPGDTLPAREMLKLMFERIPSTRDICGYGDGVVTAHEWSICSSPEGNPGYEKSREHGVV